MPTSIHGEVEYLPAPTAARAARGVALQCPSCGSSHVAQVLGDNGGVSFVCTACGHSWS
ncbi:hypothetical protein K2224_00655 [Streptomyces sp. BHT-5-2]|uniref:hypothetical protein n=1 Tax=Streptomyces sp. BHT-5-2 TaxID=2866715 RepID=UPI001C8E1FAD|nr:hypothetical protein [Streptomyces sp. BHT-5-2]QZL01919.1 hypothetical protein K2224_00655 [Streptomyces sp. BHT-5-2]